MKPVFNASPSSLARLCGCLYFVIIVLGVFGELFVRGSLVVAGAPSATIDAIAGSQLLWRAGIVGDLLMHVLDVPVIVIFYCLLRPVSKGLALLSTLFNGVQTAVLALNKLWLLVPLFVLEDAGSLNAFSAQQLHAMSQLAIKAHGFGFAIGLIFFGCACLVRGHLMARSGYFPRALGRLLQLAGASYLVNSFALLLSPSIASQLFPGVLLPAFLGELAVCLWLIVKGVDPIQWGAHAERADSMVQSPRPLP